MNHNISERDWMRFENQFGGMIGDERRRMEAHLAECNRCAEQWRDRQAWEQALRRQGALVAEELRNEWHAVDTEWSVEQAIERLRTPSPRQPAFSVFDGITLLESVMEPICGAGATRAAVKLAIRRSAGGRDSLSGTNWAVFVGNLREATTLVCGLATGRLISRAGASLPVS